jgi:hypothetical protein
MEHPVPVDRPLWETPTVEEIPIEEIERVADLDLAFTPTCASCGSCDEVG